jgi:uncharacterized phage protein gp47/JayE
MPFGVTPAGFVRKTFADLQSSIHGFLRTKISPHLQLTEKTGLGNVTNSVCDALAELWEVADGAYHAGDPANSDEAAFVATCELTGTKRRGAQKGEVLCTCNFDGGQVYAPGDLVAHVTGKPSNRWVNKFEVPDTVGTLTNIPFEAETAGAHGVANAGTLTVIAQTATGWNSITNPVEATPGRDIESIEELAVRREQELQISDAGPLPAVRGAVSRVAGVLRVKAQENKTDYWTNLPPHSFRIIVWDGVAPAADNDEIAQAIVDSGCAGIQSVGALSGNAVDADGLPVVVNFDRATQVLIYIVTNVDGSTAGVAAALVAKGAELSVGDDVIFEKLKAAAANLSTVNDIVSFTLGTAPAPVGTANLVMSDEQIPLFDVSRVTVT